MTATHAVVGGSGGLGEAICYHLADGGATVLLSYHQNADKARAVVDKIVQGGGKADCHPLDLRDPTQVETFLTWSELHGQPLSGIVNASGPAIPLRPLVDVSPQEFAGIMESDVQGAFNILTAGARHLAASKRGGAIVQLLTTAVLRTLENDGMSGIPKTAIMGIVRQLAREVSKDGVRINGVAPGVIDVGIVHSSFEADATAKAVIDLCLQRTPTPRLGEPREVAALVGFLLGDSAAYMTGQIIGVDGGYSA